MNLVLEDESHVLVRQVDQAVSGVHYRFNWESYIYSDTVKLQNSAASIFIRGY